MLIIKKVLKWYWMAVTTPLTEDEKTDAQTYSF